MAALAVLPITTAVTAQTTTPVQVARWRPLSVALYANFVYGSGGTTVNAWVQTSHDGGLTWMDIANFSLTTSSAAKIINLSALTAVTTSATITDGSLAANTAIDGILGTLYRVKWTSTGTYAGGTSLTIDATPAEARVTA